MQQHQAAPHHGQFRKLAAREQWERENGFFSDGNGLEAVELMGEVYSNRWTRKNGATL